MTAGFALVMAAMLAIGVAVGGGILLYSLVRAEGRSRPVTDRDAAEQMARRDRESGNGD